MQVDKLYPEELQDMARELGEDKYTLVDVRQPHEYQEGHIPGARLIPLPDLESALEELNRKPHVVFYCRSGVRSMAAADWAIKHLDPEKRIASMVGGFLAWEGKPLRDMPRLRLFDAPKNVPQALLRAMDLEKGAQNFYLAASAVAEATDPELARILRTLADVELAHAKVLHHRLRLAQDSDQDQGGKNDSFEQRYAALPGDILEGGLGLEEALHRAASTPANFCIEVTDLALEIEMMAYDLYKNLAGTSADEMEEMFLKLARDEQGHQRLLIRRLPRCSA